MRGILLKKVSGMVSIQDSGRLGYEAFGISKGGFLDQWLFKHLNDSSNEDNYYSIIEIWNGSISFISLCTLEFFFLGNLKATVNSLVVMPNSRITISENDGVSISQSDKEILGYVVFIGGWDFPATMGSYSTHSSYKLGGYFGKRLVNGDFLPIKEKKSVGYSSTNIFFTAQRRISKNIKVRWYKGPEFFCLFEKSIDAIVHESFSLSMECSRQGFRLNGPNLKSTRDEIETSAVGAGVIQLLPNGQLAILMADSQTTGGYPRVGWINSFDLSLIAHLIPGSNLRFEII